MKINKEDFMDCDYLKTELFSGEVKIERSLLELIYSSPEEDRNKICQYINRVFKNYDNPKGLFKKNSLTFVPAFIENEGEKVIQIGLFKNIRAEFPCSIISRPLSNILMDEIKPKFSLKSFIIKLLSKIW